MRTRLRTVGRLHATIADVLDVRAADGRRDPARSPMALRQLARHLDYAEAILGESLGLHDLLMDAGLRGRQRSALGSSDAPLADLRRGGARERLAARLSPANWRTLSAGRQSLASLPREFRNHTEIVASLSRLLDATPEDVHVFRYQAGARRLAQLTARVAAPRGLPRVAALILDERGEELRRYVSR